MARNIDPDRSADCHASGSVPTAAFIVKGARELTVCGHHLARSLNHLASTQAGTSSPSNAPQAQGLAQSPPASTTAWRQARDLPSQHR